MIRLILAGLALSLSGTLSAATASPLATLEDVKAAIARGAVIWDTRPSAEYQRGHIPGAVNIGDPTTVLRDENTENFIATQKIAELLGKAGIDPSAEIIVYGRRGTVQPYFARYTMQYFGGHRTRVFHDGVDGWTEAGLALQKGVSSRPPLQLSLRPAAAIVATTEEVLRATRDPRNVQLLDVRTRREFDGEDIRAIRGGHIPSAVNVPYELNWKDPDTARKLARKEVRDTSGLALKDRGALRDLYSTLDPDKETIVYCQSGTRASVTAAILEELGFKRVKVYDDSWLGYAAKLDAPAEKQTFVNVGLLQSQLRALAARIEALERERREATSR